jgi:hypothetical protein
LKVINPESDELFCPEELRDFGNVKLVADTWREVVQIRWFTDLLRGGLYNHITMNPFIHAVFDLNPDDSNGYRRTKSEKVSF